MPGDAHDVFLVPSQFPTIQEAVEAVVRPATIMVSPGVYAEDLVVVGKSSVVISSVRFGRRGVMLVGRSAKSVLEVENASVYLSGIEIRSNGRARGISAIGSSIALQECVIAGNQVAENHGEPSGAAMWCLKSSVRVQKSTIAGNTANSTAGSANGGGLHLADCKVEIAGSSIQANAVYASDEARGAGVWCENSQVRLWRSRVTDNALFGNRCQGAGIYFKACSAQLGGSVITGNGTSHGSGGGIFVSEHSERVVIHRNTIVRQNHPDDVIVDDELVPPVQTHAAHHAP
jgi:Right handed beta helix region